MLRVVSCRADDFYLFTGIAEKNGPQIIEINQSKQIYIGIDSRSDEQIAL